MLCEFVTRTPPQHARISGSIVGKTWKHLELRDPPRSLGTQTKLRIFNSNVKVVLLYGSETRRRKKKTLQRIQTFINRCLRRIFNIWWPERIRNEELWQRVGQELVIRQILLLKEKNGTGSVTHCARKRATLPISPCSGTHKVNGDGDVQKTAGGVIERQKYSSRMGFSLAEAGRVAQNHIPLSMACAPSGAQPRSQGFSLLNWVGRRPTDPIQKGKALGTRLSGAMGLSNL